MKSEESECYQWYIAIEYQGLNSLEIIIVNYETSVTNLRPQGWSKERTLYQVNIRELNRELFIELFIFYTKGTWSMLCTSSVVTTTSHKDQ